MRAAKEKERKAKEALRSKKRRQRAKDEEQREFQEGRIDGEGWASQAFPDDDLPDHQLQHHGEGIEDVSMDVSLADIEHNFLPTSPLQVPDEGRPVSPSITASFKALEDDLRTIDTGTSCVCVCVSVCVRECV